METNVNKLEEKLDDIKDRLIVIETKMAMINGVEKDSTEALQSTRSAHNDWIKLNATFMVMAYRFKRADFRCYFVTILICKDGGM